jgi:cytochrome c biogenesis protein CcmG/thiol:disulfide interchange protein DsbE
MNSREESRPRAGDFWTKARLAQTALAFALVAFAASSCSLKSPEEANSRRANTNATPATQTARASASVPVRRNPPAQNPSAPVANDVLPTSVMTKELKTLDGKSFRLGDYAGKVVVLDIWATWCGPCRLEIPHLVALSSEYKSRGVEVIGLTTEDPESDEEKVRDFAREFKINYTIGWIEGNTFLAISRGNSVIPQTFVIGRDGRLLRHVRGFSPQVTEILRQAIEQGLSKA